MPHQGTTTREYIDQLHSQGYVDLDVAIGGDQIGELFQSFETVLDEAFREKSDYGQLIVDGFATSVPDRPDDSCGFLEPRRVGQENHYELGREPATENKDILHFTPQTARQMIEQFRNRGGVPASLTLLIKQCTELHLEAAEASRPLLRALDLETELLAPPASSFENVHLLRLIRYLGSSGVDDPQPPDPTSLAQPHFDRSKMTTAIWESHSGLFGAPGNNTIGQPGLTLEALKAYEDRARTHPITHRSGVVKAFAGAGYNRMDIAAQARSGNLPPFLHGVQDNNPGVLRIAAVLFINEHTGVKDWTAPTKYETGYGLVEEAVKDPSLINNEVAERITDRLTLLKN